MASTARLIHQITSGIAGWLTFQQMKKNAKNFSESDIYLPVEELAKGRGYEVRREFPIPNTKPHTEVKRIDLVIVNRPERTVLLLEVKYKKDGKKLSGTISEAAKKISRITIFDIDKQIKLRTGYPIKGRVTHFKVLRVVIIAWRSKDILQGSIEFGVGQAA